MISNLYRISYKENQTVYRDLVVTSDIQTAVHKYVDTYPDRSIISIVHQSKVLI